MVTLSTLNRPLGPDRWPEHERRSQYHCPQNGRAGDQRKEPFEPGALLLKQVPAAKQEHAHAEQADQKWRRRISPTLTGGKQQHRGRHQAVPRPNGLKIASARNSHFWRRGKQFANPPARERDTDPENLEQDSRERTGNEGHAA